MPARGYRQQGVLHEHIITGSVHKGNTATHHYMHIGITPFLPLLGQVLPSAVFLSIRAHVPRQYRSSLGSSRLGALHIDPGRCQPVPL